jgi:hypothetical protein
MPDVSSATRGAGYMAKSPYVSDTSFLSLRNAQKRQLFMTQEEINEELDFTWDMYDVPVHSRPQLRRQVYQQLKAVAMDTRQDLVEAVIYISSYIAEEYLDRREANRLQKPTAPGAPGASASCKANPPSAFHAQSVQPQLTTALSYLPQRVDVGLPFVSSAPLSVVPHKDSQYDSDDDESDTLVRVSSVELDSKPDGHIEYDLTIHVPPDVIEDDHALALVQVVPPDADLSDIPESCDVYDIDLAQDLDHSDSPATDWEEEDLGQEEIYDEPDEGSYYSDDPGDDQEYEDEPDAGSYHSDSPDEDYYSDPVSEEEYSDSAPEDEDSGKG